MNATVEPWRLLPHRNAMLLVDRVIELVPGDHIVTAKSVSYSEPWFTFDDGAAGDDVAYPPMLLVESLAQSAGMLAVATSGDALRDKVMLFRSMGGVHFAGRVFPGVVLENRATLERSTDDAFILRGESHVQGQPVLTVSSLIVAFRPAEHLAATGGPPPATGVSRTT